jgi:hypothetical protein
VSTLNAARDALTEIPGGQLPRTPQEGTSRRTFALRALVLLALIPLGAFYLFPRIYDLVALPYHLDQSVASADKYNPALAEIVEHEWVTVSAFDALDRIRGSLARVQTTDAEVSAELARLTDQIAGDLHVTLTDANADVGDLVSSLEALTGQLDSLRTPVDGADAALSDNRASLGAIIENMRETAGKVHDTSVSAANAAADLFGG